MPETPHQRAIKDPLVGTIIDGRYRILAAIGRGATSSVYKAEDNLSGLPAAIKVLHPHLASDQSLVDRFEREARTAKILTHRNIAAVREYVISDTGSPYLVIEFVDGISLQELLAKSGWLPESTAVPIFTQICAALSAAHEKGVVHRDLKPGNIMLVGQSEGKYLVKLLDFGCAQMSPMLGDTVLKLTQTGEMLGSLLYMSPEQCLDQDVDARSDCYSLGCVLYETLTGTPPLSARTAFETMNKQLTTMPDSLVHTRPDLSFSKAIEKIIFKAVAKTPAKRYQSAADLMDDLLKISGGQVKLPVTKPRVVDLKMSQEKLLAARSHSEMPSANGNWSTRQSIAWAGMAVIVPCTIYCAVTMYALNAASTVWLIVGAACLIFCLVQAQEIDGRTVSALRLKAVLIALSIVFASFTSIIVIGLMASYYMPAVLLFACLSALGDIAARISRINHMAQIKGKMRRFGSNQPNTK